MSKTKERLLHPALAFAIISMMFLTSATKGGTGTKRKTMPVPTLMANESVSAETVFIEKTVTEEPESPAAVTEEELTGMVPATGHPVTKKLIERYAEEPVRESEPESETEAIAGGLFEVSAMKAMAPFYTVNILLTPPDPDMEFGERVCLAALGHLGAPYTNDLEERLGEGADCSSLVYMSYLEAGIDLKYNHEITAASEAEKCVENEWIISLGYEEELLVPGDIIFWTTDEPEREGRFLDIYHAGIYLGEGQCIEASSSEGCVVVRDVWGKESIIFTARPSADTE